jgi:hypothetical protein
VLIFNWLPGTDSKSCRKGPLSKGILILAHTDTPKDIPSKRWLQPDVAGR